MSTPFQFLELNVISAQDLAPVARSMRTYAVAWVHADRKLSTRVDTQGHNNPTWNEKIVFRVDEELLHDETSTIMIELYAVHRYKDIHVGTVRSRIYNLVPPPSTKSFHSNRPPAGMKFVALQVRRPSGRPQGILNVGATVLDSSMRSTPLYTHENGAPDGYDENVMEDDGEEAYEHGHDHLQNQELRRAKSDSSSMVYLELTKTKVIKQRGRTNSLLSESEFSLNQNQNEHSMGSPMARGRSEGINKANEIDGHKYISHDAIGSDGDVDGVAVAKGEADESEIDLHRGMAMESDLMDLPIHKKRESFIDSSDEECEIDEKKHNEREKKLSMGTISGSSRSGTPLHPIASASPHHRISVTPGHGKVGTPKHPVSGTPRHRLAGMSQRTVSGTPQHRMVAAVTPQHPQSRTSRHEKAGIFGTPQHEKARIFASPRHEKAWTPRQEKVWTPRHEKVGTPRHDKLGCTPRHGMAGTKRHGTAGTPLHAMSGTPLHPMSRTPLHKISGSKEILGKPGTPLHAISFTKFAEFEDPRKSNVMRGGTTITDSELGPSASEVAVAVAKAPRDNDHENYVVGGWNNDDSSVEGLQSKLERWQTELPPVYDNGDGPNSVSKSTTSRSAGKRNGRKKSDGLFSCFSSICGLQCTIVCGGSDPNKKKGKKGEVEENASSEVTSYL